MKNEQENKKEKLPLRERLKDKKERAKIELMVYGIFFVGVIIFARVLGSSTKNIENNNKEIESFIYSVNDNYEYDIVITKNDIIYEYYGKVLGNNSTINLKIDDKINSYTSMNQKYYALENGNYILTSIEEVYPYIDYRYLNTNNIKEYIKMAVKENDTYKIKVSDFILNSESEEYILVNIDEGDKTIVIDYTNLLKITDETINKLVVNITYNNIGIITSLEE